MTRPPLLDPAILAGPVQPRYALLINPFYPKDPNASFGKHVLTPTLALTSFAATTPEHWQVQYWDENLLDGRPPFAPMPEVVGITVHLTFARRAFELAQWYRSRGSKVVLGGLHVLSCPEECAPYADALAVGDGVQLWPRILADVEAGCLRPKYAATYESDYREDPAPRRSILPRQQLSHHHQPDCHSRLSQPVRLLLPGDRWFAHALSNAGSRRRSPRNSWRMSNPTPSSSTTIWDPTAEYLRELCHALRPLNKIWSAAVSIDVTDDPGLIRAMALAGCTGVFVGFESLTDENLSDARKKTPKTADYARRVRMLHDNGIQVNGSFVLGFDHDRKDVFTRTAEWIEENRLECATFHILTPYPATPLFRQMEAEGRLLHRDWALYDTAHAVFRPKHMTPEELEQGYAWIYQRLFSHASIWRRRPADWRSVAPYLAMSYLYKRSNRFWRLLIKYHLVHAVWRPLVELTRLRHLHFREELSATKAPCRSGISVVAGGV